MSWTTIARMDYEAATSSRVVRWLLGLLALVCILSGYMFPLEASDPITTRTFVDYGTLQNGLDYLLPLIGILLGYGAIVDERRSGQLALLLSMPYSRRDLVVGTFLGRVLAFASTLVIALVVAGALVVYPFGSLSLGWYLGFVALTVLYGTIFTGIALAISLLTRSKFLAAASAFGVYALFVLFWGSVRTGLEQGLATLGVANGELPDWLLFVYGAEPVTLYERIVTGFFVPGDAGTGSAFGSDAAWYLHEWIALLLFVAWAIVPVTIGYLRFKNADL